MAADSDPAEAAMLLTGAFNNLARRRPMRADPVEVAALLAEAFNDLATAAHLVPDPAQRLKAVTGQFQVLAEHAQSEGVGGVETAGPPGGHDGAIVWFDHTGDPAPIPDYHDRMRQVYGPHFDRLEALDAAMEAHHPTEPHAYIALVGVHPARWGQGIATSLLGDLHARLDREATPAYLEAVSGETARLYQRLGYAMHGDPFPIGDPGSPCLYPMWREPQATT